MKLCAEREREGEGPGPACTSVIRRSYVIAAYDIVQRSRETQHVRVIVIVNTYVIRAALNTSTLQNDT